MKQVLAVGRAEDNRWHVRKDGGRFWGNGLLMPLREVYEGPAGFVKILRDWTAQKRAEDWLYASEERFRSYFELGLIGMAITSPTKGMLEVNDEICDMLGYARRTVAEVVAEMTHPPATLPPT